MAVLFGLSCIVVMAVLVLVILSGNICAQGAKAVQLLFNLFCRSFYIGSNSLEIFLVVHLRSCISDNFYVFGEEFVSVLITG